MDSSEIRSRFLKFFENRGHAVIPSASLVPENDPSVLFNTAGMQPLVPYLLGQDHPMGKRIVDVQKCVRTGDLEDIGDMRHLSFFEMMGNWSLGDYFKEDAIKWSFEFLTSKEEGLGLDPNRLYVTVFEGDDNAPKDTESAEVWKKLGIPENRIYFLGADDNWWSAGENGPCGPDSEMFYDMVGSMGDLSKEDFLAAVKREDVVEIWNDVFMEYEKKDGKVIGKLKARNVDTGAGLERTSTVMQGKRTVYDTDLFAGIMSVIPQTLNEKKRRIIADHMRASVFMIAEGVIPSGKERGYVLRRLLRRAAVYTKESNIDPITVAGKVIEKFAPVYSNLNKEVIFPVISLEFEQFEKTLTQGLKEFEKNTDPFVLATTYGFPIELTQELAKEKGQTVDLEDFHKKMAEHQKLSQTASAGMFKGGLANHNEKTVRLHTAHHLLLAGLQAVVGKEVKQRGSNITEERLRIDFLCDHKLTDEEKQKVEAWVDDKISQGLPVTRTEMPLAEAQRLGAEMEFGAKYPDMVSVYYIGGNGNVENAISKEFCGGPHVQNTKELGQFKILKEEAVSAGVRRIKAVLL